jgi:hypothetical protein
MLKAYRKQNRAMMRFHAMRWRLNLGTHRVYAEIHLTKAVQIRNDWRSINHAPYLCSWEMEHSKLLK